MDDLFFALQTDKQYKRQMLLLAYLKKIKKTVSVQELAKELKCTPPTLRKDLKDLNLKLPAHYHLNYQKREGVRFTSPIGGSVDFAILALGKQSISFRIIENVFLNRVLTLHQVARQLFISESTLRKTITHVNRILKEFRLSLTSKNIDIIGSEVDIRYFFFSFYFDFKDQVVIAKEDDLAKKIYKELLKSARQSNATHLHFNYTYAIIWIQIVKQRLHSRNFVRLAPGIVEGISKQKRFQPFHQIFSQLFLTVFNHKVDLLEESVWMYQSCLHCISYTDLSDAAEYVYRRDVSEKLVNEVNQFLLPILPMSLVNSSAIEKMQSYLINMRLLHEITPLFGKVSAPLKSYIQQTDSQMYLRWCEQLYQQDFFPEDTTVYIEDVAVSLTLFQKGLVIEQPMNHQRILFSFHGETGYDDYLILRSKKLINKSIQAEYCVSQVITKQLIEEKEIGLVICNYPLPTIETFACRIIRLSYIPSNIEWEELRTIIQELGVA